VGEGELEEARASSGNGAVWNVVVAEEDGRIVGLIRFQLEDRLFWPDLEGDDSAFVHRWLCAARMPPRRVDGASAVVRRSRPRAGRAT
jgi:hypothetical protein